MKVQNHINGSHPIILTVVNYYNKSYIIAEECLHYQMDTISTMTILCLSRAVSLKKVRLTWSKQYYQSIEI